MKTRNAAIACLTVLTVAGCSPAEPVYMPDVVGQDLDVALLAIEDAGINGEPEVDGGGLFGVVVESNWVVCEQSPAAGAEVTGAPSLAVDRSCDTDSNEPSEEPSEETTPKPEKTTAAPDTYVYEGPDYEVVTVDYGAGMGVLDQYWILIDDLDYSSDAYTDEVKAIITDVAKSEGTTLLLVQIVSDAEIIEAESNATIGDFMASHDADYWNDVMVPKEAASWIASYAGGIDYNAGELSEADSAFEIAWWPYGDYEPERWKPEI